MMRARCVSPGSQPGNPNDVILLKVRESDWCAMQYSSGPIKILQARLAQEPLFKYPVIDCCSGEAVVVTHVSVSHFETMEIAELFTGGFMGWTQGSYALYKLGAPISVRWGLEKAVDCAPMQRTMVPSITFVSKAEDLPQPGIQPAGMTVIQADVWHDWWLKMFVAVPVNTWTISAPCQPWSLAGRASGLSSEVGRILLRLADLAAVFQPTLILFEQVAGFAVHRDSGSVLKAWQEAGYVVSWKSTLDLALIMPCTRNRHLIVMTLRHHSQPAISLPTTWECECPRSLHTAAAIFDLPWELLSAHVPSAQVLATYLDSANMPRGYQASAAQARAYRVKSACDGAGCFMAQYGHAHLLPPDLLRAKGLFGSLLSQGPFTRFFSACEIASLHCTILPTLCCRNRRLSMRLLGNCISTPHAAITLLKGFHVMGQQHHLTASDVVTKCIELRLTNQNSMLLPSGQDWILCRHEDAMQVMQASEGMHLPAQLPALAQLLQPLQIVTPSEVYEIWLSPTVPWRQAVASLGYPAATLQHVEIHMGDSCSEIQVPFAPQLPGSQDECRYVHDLGMLIVVTTSRTAVLPRVSASHGIRLATLATEFLSDSDAPRYLANVAGHRTSSLRTMSPLSLLLPEDKEPDIFSATFLSALTSSARLQVDPGQVRIPGMGYRVPAPSP